MSEKKHAWSRSNTEVVNYSDLMKLEVEFSLEPNAFVFRDYNSSRRKTQFDHPNTLSEYYK